jgi:DNA polymerase III delta prime subunit
MHELAAERAAIKAALDELQLDPWAFEEDAGARPESIRQTFLTEVEASDLYIGVFWKEYGEHTIEEFEYARKLGKDCLIYENRDFRDGPRDPNLENFLNGFRDVNSGVTVKWFHSGEELARLVKMDVARWQAAIVHAHKVLGVPAFDKAPANVPDGQRRDLLILLKKVRQFWIEGILENSVHQKMLIALGKEKMADAVEHPWERVLELPDRSARSIPTDKTISEVFVEAGQYLLILGEPGAGKTTTLLELARDLLDRSERDEGLPVPVILNLSSWTDKNRLIASWITSELKEKYQIPEKLGAEWIRSRSLLVLLDGLDEVRSELQNDCVEAINRFVNDSMSGVAVCCRLTEYESLRARLRLNAAVCLQPLTLEQIDDYLLNAGSEQDALRNAVKVDTGLQTLIQTPLMLNVTSIAYHGRSVETLESGLDSTPEDLRKIIFDTYIERMFERKGRSNLAYPKEKIKFWLSWMGKQMKARSQSVFMIESIQPNWIVTRWHFLVYLLISRLAGALFLPVLTGISLIVCLLAVAVGKMQKENFVNLGVAWVVLTLGLLTMGLFAFVADAAWQSIAYRLGSTARKFIKRSLFSVPFYFVLTVFVLVAITLFTEEIGNLLNLSTLFGLLLISIGYVIIQWLVFGAYEGADKFNSDIITVETLKWSWLKAFKLSLISIVSIFALLVFLWSAVFITNPKFFLSLNGREIEKVNKELLSIESDSKAKAKDVSDGELQSLRDRQASLNDRLEQLVKEENEFEKTGPENRIAHAAEMSVVALIFSALSAIVLGFSVGLLFGGVDNKLVEKKTRLNHGIRLSARNAVFVAVRRGTLFGILGGAISYPFVRGFSGVVYVTLISGLSSAFFFGFKFGGYALIKHYCLRLLLCLKNRMPWNYVRFLNYCTKLIFLQRVGGGYIFIHRLMLEHFATHYDENRVATKRK